MLDEVVVCWVLKHGGSILTSFLLPCGRWRRGDVRKGIRGLARSLWVRQMRTDVFWPGSCHHVGLLAYQ